LRFDLDRIDGPEDFVRAGGFLVIMLLIHVVPTALYRPHLSWRECLASGLLQATNLSFIVVAVTVGTELGELREINGAALILAGLVSAVVFPAIATTLLGGAKDDAAVHAMPAEERL
jgi:Kef-type K+ transport system membrane component KefB